MDLKKNNSKNDTSKQKKRKLRYRIYIYIIVIIFLIFSIFSIYHYMYKKIDSKAYNKEKTIEIPKSDIENPDVIYDSKKEAESLFGENIIIDNKGMTKIDLKNKLDNYELTDPAYIKSYGNINDTVSYTLREEKDNNGIKVEKDVIILRYRDLTINNVKVNQKANTLEIILTADKQTNEKTRYYKSEITMEDMLDRNIKYIQVIYNDLTFLSSTVKLK